MWSKIIAMQVLEGAPMEQRAGLVVAQARAEPVRVTRLGATRTVAFGI